MLTYQLGAEMLNFGAFIAFMGVNLAAFTATGCAPSGAPSGNFIYPLLGFAFCAYLWWSLRLPAKIAGGAWLAAGIVYGAIKTGGFRRQIVSFEVPAD